MNQELLADAVGQNIYPLSICKIQKPLLSNPLRLTPTHCTHSGISCYAQWISSSNYKSPCSRMKTGYQPEWGVHCVVWLSGGGGRGDHVITHIADNDNNALRVNANSNCFCFVVYFEIELNWLGLFWFDSIRFVSSHVVSPCNGLALLWKESHLKQTSTQQQSRKCNNKYICMHVCIGQVYVRSILLRIFYWNSACLAGVDKLWEGKRRFNDVGCRKRCGNNRLEIIVHFQFKIKMFTTFR